MGIEEPKKIERRFFDKQDTDIIERGLEKLWEKFQKLKKENKLPTHLVFLDSSARVFAPAVKEIVTSFYEDSGIKIPTISFLVPNLSQAKKMEELYGPKWKKLLMAEEKEDLRNKILWHKENIKTKEEASKDIFKEKDYDLDHMDPDSIDIKTEKQDIKDTELALDNVPQKIQGIEDADWDIKDRIREILDRTKSKPEDSRLLVIDDYVYSGKAFKNVAQAAKQVGVEIYLFAFFFAKWQRDEDQKGWEYLAKELGNKFVYGADDRMSSTSGFRFQEGRTLDKYGERPTKENFTKAQIVGVEKDLYDPKKYVTPVPPSSRIKDLSKEIRAESTLIGKRMVKRLKQQK